MPTSQSQFRRPRRLLALVLVALALAGTACASQNEPQNVLDPEGPIARQLDSLWDPVFWIATGIFFLVEIGLVYVLVRFRQRSEDDAPRQIHGNARLEIAWTIVPALILAVVGVMTVTTVFDINRRAVAGETLFVEVIGHQWWWEYRYPQPDGDTVVTANELHIPAGERVQLQLTAADVMHNFWPPKLAGKVYAIPGRLNYMQIQADDPGVYLGQCAEYCGLSHANMRLAVIAHEPEDFGVWLANQKREQSIPPEPPAETAEPGATVPRAEEPEQLSQAQLVFDGFQLFSQSGCHGCHTVDGIDAFDGKVGPNLTHFASRECFAGCIFELNETNLRRWLRDPPGVKPMMPDDGIGMPDLGLSEDEITKLIAYLETLK